jgi:peptidoglycan/xylan/chitin deacetylase (PgdA/CDA1 family)
MIDSSELFRKLVLHGARVSGLAPFANRFLSGRGAVLMLHRVTRQPRSPLGVNRHLAITPDFLDAALTEVRSLGYEYVSIDEAVERIGASRPGRPFVTVTADDGYRDNLAEALPVLERHQAPVTVYVAPALTQGTVLLWWELLEEIVARRDRLRLATASGPVAFECDTPAAKLRCYGDICRYLTRSVAEEDQVATMRALALSCGIDPMQAGHASLMTWDEVRRIAAHPLVTIGAHTVHHYNLRRLSPDKAAREIADARTILALELGEAPRHMAYPYGLEAAVGEREVEIAQASGFASAVTTRHGLLQPEHAFHLHALPRISLNGRYQRVSHLSTMLSGITTPLANRGRRIVTV